MDKGILKTLKKSKDYWIGRIQELQSRPEELAQEITESVNERKGDTDSDLLDMSDIVLKSQQGGYYVAIMDGEGLITTQGETEAEALENFLDAYKLMKDYKGKVS